MLRNQLAMGILELDKKNAIPARGDKLVYPKGTLLNNFLYLGDKPGGVEPGFLALKIDRDLIEKVNEFFHSKKANLNINTIEECKLFFQKFREHAATQQLLEQLTNEAKGKVTREIGHTQLTLYLFKQDYNDSKFKVVSPPTTRLAQTSAIQNLPSAVQSVATILYQLGRLRSPSSENLNAILECFANDLARASGMEVQQQHLMFGQYEDGHPKILTSCVWDVNLRGINAANLRGSEKGKYENYLVKDIMVGKNQYAFSTPLVNAGQNLALFLQQNDRDVFGSKGQNKGIRLGKIFGFDFGHAYRDKNRILNSLQTDFSFTQPADKNEIFKNISLCYDSTISEKMEGLFCIYKMSSPDIIKKSFSAAEIHNIEKALALYLENNPQFEERYNNITAGATKKIYTAYQDKIQTLIKASHGAEKKEYIKYGKSLEGAHQISEESNLKMFAIFKERMQLSPIQLSLLENLEKATSETSLTSGDNKVILSHLRVIPEKRIPWEFKQDKDNNFYLVASEKTGLKKEMLHKVNNILESYLPGISTESNHTIRINLPKNPSEREKFIRELGKIFSEPQIIQHKFLENKIDKNILNAYTKHHQSQRTLRDSSDALLQSLLEPVSRSKEETSRPSHGKGHS